ncbi:hypothetical protein Tco_1141760 [Tanacetum coccineum]
MSANSTTGVLNLQLGIWYYNLAQFVLDFFLCLYFSFMVSESAFTEHLYAFINTYLANEKNVDVDVDTGQSALQTNDFNQHYAEAQRESELEKKRKDMILEQPCSEFWFDEPIDGMDVAELKQYISSLQKLKRKVLTRVDELMMMNNVPALFGSNVNNNTPIQGPECVARSARQGPNVMQGL